MIKGYEGTLYGANRQLKFTDVYSDVADFLSDYASIGVPTTIKQDSAQTLYYLLYGRYGNSTIASSDLTRFKYNLFGIVWQYGPSWEAKVEIQKKLRNLTDTELTTGTKAIYNRAENPGTTPTTGSLSELTYINEQNTSNTKKSKLEAYAELYALIDMDVTQAFIDKFKKLFLNIVQPELPLLYEEDEDD